MKPYPFWPNSKSDDEYEEPDAILDHLDNCSVVSVYLSEDLTTVNLIDGCDGVFPVGLNKERMGRLIAELQEMHGRMKT